MTAEGHIESAPNKDGKEVETLYMEFTNGSLEQLRDLAKFFDVKDENPAEVVKLGISFLQNVKERHDSGNNEESK